MIIILYHNRNKVQKVITQNNDVLSFDTTITIASVMTELAFKYSYAKIVWCNINFKGFLNLGEIEKIFHHNKMMLSYCSNDLNYLGKMIGYVEESPFIKVNKKVTFPTWQMNSDVGVIHASVLLAIKDSIKAGKNLDYFLNSIAKIGMPLGLLCYSEPRLFNNHDLIIPQKFSNFTLFRFVKQHYKTRWIFLLFLNIFLYENQLLVLPVLSSLFYSKRKSKNDLLDKIQPHSLKQTVTTRNVDVIIPTLGRKKYLYDFLKDLSNQKHLIKKVIIVEQNPDVNSVSELDYLKDENWPFQIKHIFIHEMGACNARNLAIAEVDSEWTFMADDDIRIENNFLEEAFLLIEKQGGEQITFGCYTSNYPKNKKINQTFQWNAFGSGCSIVKSKNIAQIFYNTKFEFGFGEDSDFGMQLRNLGFDVLYFPKPEILHLKAPIGGFRIKPVLAWQKDLIQPKPSPTIMLYKILYLTSEQINGYKTTLFFKYYKSQSIKNPFAYFSTFKKQWKSSIYWANELNKKE
ncbi:glycosyltransferase family 2 protein [Flavobacterium defluvii]|uniref:Glycosyltransferase, GT2 family n=1 Tax=Flavobacterium defluvii TaxID=370979 RepID=A0A1M5NSJ3_9FLAO|nr:glycosyltransferase family A protein [Flavobacterium defluvii]SHG92521.1 Glycosyltransferase, GT2 family [Flavobacterium defluvii]